MNKKQKSLFNAVTAFMKIVLTSILNLVLAKEILLKFGSDYNGINATISQIISTLLILEGGFTLASNVALFTPLVQKDYKTINGILSATRIQFLKVGLIVFTLGTLVAFLYPFTITSEMPYFTVVALTYTVLIPAAANLGINMKYRVMILADQKEYIITTLTTVTTIIGTVLTIVAVKSGCDIVFARSITMAFSLICYFLIQQYCKKHYSYIDFKEKPLYNEIKGTKQVIFLKLTSVLYTTIPTVVISTISGNGTLLASVYSVYKSVTIMIRNAITAVINAPRLSFGALIAEEKKDELIKLFNVYELIACLAINIFVGTTALLILPFITLYTNGVSDISYYNPILAAIMLLTVFIEILHIPSGQIIQMSGKFKVSKNIQFTACIVLLISMVLGKIFWGMFGVAASTLLGALVLAVLEIGYVRKYIFKASMKNFLKNFIPSAIIYTVATLIGNSNVINFDNYYMFIFYGMLCAISLSLVSVATYYIVNKSALLTVKDMCMELLLRNKTKRR